MRSRTFFPAATVLLLLAAGSTALGQDTVFSANFDSAVLGSFLDWGEEGLAEVGNWSAPIDPFTEEPFVPIGQGNWGADTLGIVPSPYGDGNNMFYFDRPANVDGFPQEDIPFELDETSGDYTGLFSAILTESVPLLGSEVGFQVLTSRSGGNEEKSYSVIGRDADGNESFHVRVSANNTGGERLGYVSAGETVFDLPTSVGQDGAQDLNNTGGLNTENGPGANADIGQVLLKLGGEGFVIDFAYPEGNGNGKDTYVSELLPYNGNATEIAQVDFTYEASTNNNFNSGYLLDEVFVTTFGDITLGDFDSNGTIDAGDFNILAANFGTGTTFSEGDINFDGDVTLKDFAELKQLFTSQAAGAAASVPEPGTGVLVWFGASALMLLRRRHRNLVA